MLVLSRKKDEEIVIGDNVRITIVGIHGGRVRLGIIAPKEVPVDRLEVRLMKEEAEKGKQTEEVATS